MGIFDGKLKKQVEELSAEVERLSKSNAEICDENKKLIARAEETSIEVAKIAEENACLRDENDELKDENFALNEEKRRLISELNAYVEAEKKTASRLVAADKEADETKRLTMYKYLVELKALKLLAEKFRAVYGKEQNAEKMRLTDLLLDFLKETDQNGYLYKAKETAEKIDQALGATVTDTTKNNDDTEEEFEFDLDEAINPTGELDLETLCRELGVFGED